jgi:lysophospholipase L1-like esterase
MKSKILKTAVTAVALLLSMPTQSETLLFIGDSITDGNWGSPVGWPCPSEKRSHTDLNHIYGHGYAEMISAYYQATFPDSGYVCHNRGISGNTLANLEARWDNDALALNPDVVSILIGTNDVSEWLNAGNMDYDGWEARYRALLDRTRAKNPNVKFVLCTPFVAPVGKIGEAADFPQRAAAIARLDRIVKSIAADYGATLIDYNQMITELYRQYPKIAPSYWIWDGIHPTPATHYRMAQLWIDTMK